MTSKRPVATRKPITMNTAAAVALTTRQRSRIQRNAAIARVTNRPDSRNGIPRPSE